MPTFAHLIYTYDRLDAARINQELSKQMWGVPIIHAYNGQSELGYAPYLEDHFVRISNRGHYQGAVDLVNAGVRIAQTLESIDYLLVTAADTWLTKPQVLTDILETMSGESRHLATSAWGLSETPLFQAGFAFDCFVLDMQWQRTASLFPLDYQTFLARYQDTYLAMGGEGALSVERLLSYSWIRHWAARFDGNDVSRQARHCLHRLTAREPMLDAGGYGRIMHHPEIGVSTHHDPVEQRAVLQDLAGTVTLGPVATKFLQATAATIH